jgi:nucleoid-associated protein YgaU
MIFLNSRYAKSEVMSVTSTTDVVRRTVLRTPPTALGALEFREYLWVDGDRIENISFKMLGDVNLWWYIMDFNPQIMDPLSIEPGTLIRVPKYV